MDPEHILNKLSKKDLMKLISDLDLKKELGALSHLSIKELRQAVASAVDVVVQPTIVKKNKHQQIVGSGLFDNVVRDVFSTAASTGLLGGSLADMKSSHFKKLTPQDHNEMLRQLYNRGPFNQPIIGIAGPIKKS